MPAAPSFEQVLHEQAQSHETRKEFFRKLDKALGVPVVSFFTSFTYPVSMDQVDCDALESLLQKTDVSKGFALMISSPGGQPLAAERIIRVCKSYSGTGAFTAIVPGLAKSAATMVCLGAEKIIMGPTSELGPVDPQILLDDKRGRPRWHSAHNIVSSYDKLFRGATRAKGNLEPYLQQLSGYDAKELAEIQTAIRLADDIAVKALGSGMMNGQGERRIREQIRIFLEPTAGTVDHGRAIGRKTAKSCGLRIENWETTDQLWKTAHALFVRSSRYVASVASKCVESANSSYSAPPFDFKEP